MTQVAGAEDVARWITDAVHAAQLAGKPLEARNREALGQKWIAMTNKQQRVMEVYAARGSRPLGPVTAKEIEQILDA